MSTGSFQNPVRESKDAVDFMLAVMGEDGWVVQIHQHYKATGNLAPVPLDNVPDDAWSELLATAIRDRDSTLQRLIQGYYSPR